MIDLIKREDAVNAVEMFFKDAYIEDADVHCTDMVYEINHITSASTWHRLEEELPPVGEVVWCYFSGSKLYEALALLLVTQTGDLVWQDGTHCFNFSNGVTHWMPIEPPKEDADVDK